MALDQPEQLHQPPTGQRSRTPVRPVGDEEFRAWKRHAGITRRLHPSIPFRPCRLLPAYRTGTTGRTGKRLSGLSYPEQLRHPDGNRTRLGKGSRRYAQCHPVHRRIGHPQPDDLLPDHVQQQHPVHRPERDRFRRGEIPRKALG